MLLITTELGNAQFELLTEPLKTTSSAIEGTPAGCQFVDKFQLDEFVPVQVFSAAWIIPANTVWRTINKNVEEFKYRIYSYSSDYNEFQTSNSSLVIVTTKDNARIIDDNSFSSRISGKIDGRTNSEIAIGSLSTLRKIYFKTKTT